MNGNHHLHVRKRVYKHLEPFPHPNALKRRLDRVMVFIAIAGPLATLPQVYDVLVTRNVEGLSLLTWGLWTILSGIWVLYGYLHKETPILVSNLLYVLLNGLVAIAILAF